MKEKIIGLIQLQDCDNRVNEVMIRKTEGPRKIQVLENQLQAGEMRFREDSDTLESLKKDRRLLEQDIQELDTKIEKSGIKLNSVKSNKEYTAALKEIDDFTRGKSLMEDRALQIMEEIETYEKKCLGNRDEQKELKKMFEQGKNEIEAKIDKLKKKSIALEKERAKCCKSIDDDLLKRYLFIIERKGGQAITSVIAGVCQNCHVGIPPQQFNELIKGQSLLTCPNCNRILYWGEDEYYQRIGGK